MNDSTHPTSNDNTNRPGKPQSNKNTKKLSGKESAALIKSRWSERAAVIPQGAGTFKISLNIPSSNESIPVNRLETDDNVVKVWLNDNVSGEPDYVIVNPPTEVYDGPDNTIVDPLGAIAESINGAQK